MIFFFINQTINVSFFFFNAISVDRTRDDSLLEVPFQLVSCIRLLLPPFLLNRISHEPNEKLVS